MQPVLSVGRLGAFSLTLDDHMIEELSSGCVRTTASSVLAFDCRRVVLKSRSELGAIPNFGSKASTRSKRPSAARDLAFAKLDDGDD